MVSFRNLAVHEYQELKLEVLKGILSNNLADLADFAVSIIHWAQSAAEES